MGEEKEGKKEGPKGQESPPKPDPDLKSFITHGRQEKSKKR